MTGGFDEGFRRAGMNCAWAVEIDPAPRSVFARHFPEVKLYEDVRTVGRHNLATVDVLCGGFPCQDLSVAGRREGLDGERSGLWYEFHRIIKELAPRWVVIENVPGLLSSNGGRDFAVVLRGLVECGYGVSYRVLDAQYFGVAQRRRRVFIVGSLGAGSSAQVLFESEGVPWNPPARGEAGAGVAACLDGSPYADREAEHSRLTVANAISASAGHHGHSSPGGDGSDNLIAGTFQNTGHGWWNETPVAQTVRTPDGGGSMEANLVAANNFGERDVETSLSASNERIDGDTETFIVNCYPIDSRNALRDADKRDAMNRQGIGLGEDGDPCPTLTDIFTPAVAFRGNATTDVFEEGCGSVTTNSGGGNRLNVMHNTFGVRRLTPTECERLMGFPDGWTALDADGKAVSDSARYRMLGNSIVVPCAEWIGRRIMEVEALNAARERPVLMKVG